MTSATLRTAAATLGVALVVAGCAGLGVGSEDAAGSDDGTTRPTTAPADGASGLDAEERGLSEEAAAIVEAVERTLEAGTAEVDTRALVRSETDDHTVTGSGLADFAQERRQLDVRSQAGELSSYTDAEGVYIARPGDEPSWVRVRASELAGAPLDAPALSTLLLQDPVLGLALLRGVTDVRQLGSDELQGEQVQGHEVDVDARAAAQLADPGTAAAIEAIIEQLGTDRLTMQVWLDGNGLVRQVTNQASLAGGGSDGQVESAVILRELGSAPSLAAPDGEPVLDVDAATLDTLVQELTSSGD